MRRLVVLVLIALVADASAAFGGETLRGVAERVARSQPPPVDRQSSARQSSARTPTVTSPVQKNWAMAQEPGALSTTGVRKRTKFLIFMGAAAGVVAAWYTIDHNVEDNTPSTLGLRQD